MKVLPAGALGGRAIGGVISVGAGIFKIVTGLIHSIEQRRAATGRQGVQPVEEILSGGSRKGPHPVKCAVVDTLITYANI